MRSRFDMQLDELNNELISMGAMVETSIAAAVKALLDNDREQAKAAIMADDEIDRKEKSIEALCLRLLLQQHPVASDLRLISAALKMITDIERIGDQAADIAEIVTVADLTVAVGHVHIREMADEAIKMVTGSIDAFVKRDKILAEEVIARDDTVDGLFSSVKNDIIKIIAEKNDDGEAAVDIIMIAKYLERIGDHAVNIAEWVLFSITGVHKDANAELRKE